MVASSTQANLWYDHLGHPFVRILSQVINLCNFNSKFNKHFDFCSSCQCGKNKRLRFSLATHATNSPLQLIHIES